MQKPINTKLDRPESEKPNIHSNVTSHSSADSSSIFCHLASSAVSLPREQVWSATVITTHKPNLSLLSEDHPNPPHLIPWKWLWSCADRRWHHLKPLTLLNHWKPHFRPHSCKHAHFYFSSFTSQIFSSHQNSDNVAEKHFLRPSYFSPDHCNRGWWLRDRWTPLSGRCYAGNDSRRNHSCTATHYWNVLTQVFQKQTDGKIKPEQEISQTNNQQYLSR